LRAEVMVLEKSNNCIVLVVESNKLQHTDISTGSVHTQISFYNCNKQELIKLASEILASAMRLADTVKADTQS
jgi:hypothetical protein